MLPALLRFTGSQQGEQPTHEQGVELGEPLAVQGVQPLLVDQDQTRERVVSVQGHNQQGMALDGRLRFGGPSGGLPAALSGFPQQAGGLSSDFGVGVLARRSPFTL